MSEVLGLGAVAYFAGLLCALAIDVLVGVRSLARGLPRAALAAALHGVTVLAASPLLLVAAHVELRRFGAEHMALGVYNVVGMPLALLQIVTACAVALAAQGRRG